MSRPLCARVDLSAVAHNLQVAQSIGNGRTVAVIKANAYGHGLGILADLLAQADALAVATIDEAVLLRQRGIRGRVLVLEGVFDRAAQREALAHRLDIVVHSDYQIVMLREPTSAEKLTVWLKIDTGMGRLGFHYREAATAWNRLRQIPTVGEIVLMTHLACADEPGHAQNDVQLSRFQRASRGLAAAQSIANSAALLGLPSARRHWNRAGIMLYGVNPLKDPEPCLDLQCTLHLQSRLIAVRSVCAGDSIGYGCDFTFSAPGRYGIVACGYGDGYPRHAPSGTPVLVDGRRSFLIGRVSMDMLAVDLTGLPEADVGSPVTLWGEGLPVTEVAERAGTIAYELLTGLTERVPREYVNCSDC